MPRARYQKAVIRRVSGAPADGQVAVYQPGTNTPIAAKLYKADTGIDELPNPFLFTNGVVDFFLDTPQRVRVVITPTGAAAQTFDDQDVEAAPGSEYLGVNTKAVGDLPATYPIGYSMAVVTADTGAPNIAAASGWPQNPAAGINAIVLTYRAAHPGTGWQVVQNRNGDLWQRSMTVETGLTGYVWGTFRKQLLADAQGVVLRGEQGNSYTFPSNVGVAGFDLFLGAGDQTSRGSSGVSRALVKNGPFGSVGPALVINFAGDFVGGTHIAGPRLSVLRGVRAGHDGNMAATSTGIDLLIDQLMS